MCKKLKLSIKFAFTTLVILGNINYMFLFKLRV